MTGPAMARQSRIGAEVPIPYDSLRGEAVERRCDDPVIAVAAEEAEIPGRDVDHQDFHGAIVRRSGRVLDARRALAGWPDCPVGARKILLGFPPPPFRSLVCEMCSWLR